jgi:hypothetical protein
MLGDEHDGPESDLAVRREPEVLLWLLGHYQLLGARRCVHVIACPRHVFHMGVGTDAQPDVPGFFLQKTG